MKKLRKLLLMFVLLGGAFAGAPMPPDELEELLQKMNEAKALQVMDIEASKGDGTPDQASDAQIYD